MKTPIVDEVIKGDSLSLLVIHTLHVKRGHFSVEGVITTEDHVTTSQHTQVVHWG